MLVYKLIFKLIMFTRVSLFVLIAALLGVTCEAFSKEETEILHFLLRM